MKKLVEFIKESYKISATKNGQRGSVDMASIMMMGISMVFLAVGFIMFPIVTTATTSLLAYQYSSNSSITDSTFTGFTSVIGIVPLLVLLGFVCAAVIEMWMGVKVAQGKASTKLNLGGTIMLGLSMVFIAIGLIILPVALDGVSSVLHGSGSGISSSYTGLESILEVVPLIILIAFVGSAVVTGYFGVKNLNAG